MCVITVMDFSAASSYVFAILHTFLSFFSTSLCVCKIKPWSLQPEGHLETFGEEHEVNLRQCTRVRDGYYIARGTWATFTVFMLCSNDAACSDISGSMVKTQLCVYIFLTQSSSEHRAMPDLT